MTESRLTFDRLRSGKAAPTGINLVEVVEYWSDGVKQNFVI